MDGHNARRLLTFNAPAQVEGVTLYRGRADYGGGAYLEYNGLVHACVIDGNRANYSDNNGIGGGTYCRQGGTLRNCLIMRNYGGWLCGSASAYYSMLLENCTVVSNDCFATSSGVGAGSPSIIRNCIVMYNKTNATTRQIVGLGNGSSLMYHNCSDTNMANCPASRGGNIDADPQFFNWRARAVHLLSTSPCMNTGSNATWMLTATDVEGNPRLLYSQVDMGAYEVNTSAVLRLSPTVLAFVDVEIGTTQQQPVVVENLGTAVLLGSVGAVPAPFGVVGAAAYTIPAGASTDVSIAFAPTAETNYDAVITFTGGGVALLAVSGSAVPEPVLALGMALACAALRRARHVPHWIIRTH